MDELAGLYDSPTVTTRVARRERERLAVVLEHEDDDAPVTADRDGELDGIVDPFPGPSLD